MQPIIRHLSGDIIFGDKIKQSGIGTNIGKVQSNG